MWASHCLRRPIAAVVLFLSLVLSLTGCFSNAVADSPGLPKGAEETLDSALTTMFSWRPAFEQSPGPAFQRARLYVTPEVVAQLVDLEDELPPDWEAWAEAGAIVTPSFSFERVPGSDDVYTEHTSWVAVTQVVTDSDGRTIGEHRFSLRPVVVTFADGTWRISSISGIDEAGGGLCPRDPNGACRVPARDAVAER